jgi:hydrogenase expression/formation protein HypE
LNPFGLITSGSLLIAVNPRYTEKVLTALNSSRVSAAKIGKILPKEQGLTMRKHKEVLELPIFKGDEITKILD